VCYRKTPSTIAVALTLTILIFTQSVLWFTQLALFSFHITIIITIIHFICYTAYYCSIVSENKPSSSFHSCLVGFYSHSKSPHSSSLLFSHLISSYVNIFVTLISFCEEIVIVLSLMYVFLFKSSDC